MIVIEFTVTLLTDISYQFINDAAIRIAEKLKIFL